jgi:hypothetical protein
VSVRSGRAPEFLQQLRHVDRDGSAAVDELLSHVCCFISPVSQVVREQQEHKQGDPHIDPVSLLEKTHNREHDARDGRADE